MFCNTPAVTLTEWKQTFRNLITRPESVRTPKAEAFTKCFLSKHYEVFMRSHRDGPVGAAPSGPAGADRGCPGTSAEPPEPQRDPGSPQTPPGGRH